MSSGPHVIRTTYLTPRLPDGPQQVMVGFPRGQVTPFVVNKAVWNEFGTRTIPERPFFRRAMRGNADKYTRFLAARARQIIEGRETLARTVNQLGVMAVGDVQHEITALRDPPNAPSTIKRKGSSKPLVDTGELRQSVTYRVMQEAPGGRDGD